MVKISQSESMKKYLIPVFCLLHMAAIFWWTLPHSFGGMVLTEDDQNTFEAKLFKGMMLDDFAGLSAMLEKYIDVTGSQQYWDFFAPHSPKYHQYLSVCGSVVNDSEQGKIMCKDKPLFSNLDDDLSKNAVNFRFFGSDRSRLYRLTENLANLEDPNLLKAFVNYYQSHQYKAASINESAQLVLHQFELHPELKDLPKAGYRMDKVLLALP
jgi:hypothetical protein